jgi:dynein heavy chain, axonemal
MCDPSDTFYNRWFNMDGPVDTLWIETMNSVLDDSKLLTLTNGDRIKIIDPVRLLFEVEDLNQASPATVSRAGMVYLDIEELPWKTTLMESWIKKKDKEDLREKLKECVTAHLDKVMLVKKATCQELVPTSEAACIRNLCNLFDCLSPLFKYDPKEDREGWLNYVEKWFVFSMIWSVCVTVDVEGRREMDNIMRENTCAGLPISGSVFDYFINTDRKDFQLWSEKIPKDEQKYFKDKKFHEIQV